MKKILKIYSIINLLYLYNIKKKFLINHNILLNNIDY